MSTSKRLFAPLILMFGMIIAMVGFAGPANAQPYVPASTVSVSDQTPAAGSSLTFCGADFQAGETVTIALDNGTAYPSVVADSSGAFCTTLVLGATLTGTHTLTATGTTSGSTASIEITVAGVTASVIPTATAGLAFTGAAVLGIGALGALILVGGALLVFAGRRRKVNA